FALSGALVAVRKHLDIFGVLVLGGATGLGGGFLRDVLIDATPPAALADWRYLLVPTAAALITFVAPGVVGRMERVINVLDAAGLGLFCITGSLKALEYGLGPVPAALMGMVTGIGGGMIRDLLAGRVPIVFGSELYATPALAGATWAVLAQGADWDPVLVAAPAFVLCFLWRVVALRRGWEAPKPSGSASV
ncbi:MAG: trimeric intracellular cation channel family protein, partial [Myxococcales bacterium]